MILDSELAKLKAEIIKGCHDHYDKQISFLGDSSLSTYAIFTTESADSVGVAYSTEIEPKTLLAALWDSIWGSYECFSGADEILNKLDSVLYDDVFEDYPVATIGQSNFESFYLDKKFSVLKDSISVLVEDGFFKRSAFSSNVFISLQFPDPDVDSKNRSLGITKNFNSEDIYSRYKSELFQNAM